jgi:hypothetical protein
MLKKLYHGSEQLLAVLKPMGVNMGTRLQKPHWAIYFWGSSEKARKWAIYQYFRRVHKCSLMYHIDSGGFIITKQQYAELVKLCRGDLTYVYDAEVPITTVGFGSAPEIEEYTVRVDVVPKRRHDIVVDVAALKSACLVVSQQKINEYLENLRSGKYRLERGLLLYLLLDPEKDAQRHKYQKQIKEGTLQPGDSLESFQEPPSAHW